ncbi:MAG: 1-phosphofructokinase [Lachnospiraceae bacterium]|nr:1-phosphofructokinase [Lachnospiraceae bacterium]MBQ8846802.1 1-phosphofructokinase [Lachnospiraceae bacterium]
MFYTMTLNPALDYNMTLKEFAPERVNRSVKEEMIPGGKGLMVSRMLKNLGIESTAFGLVAGFTGAELTRMVHELGVRTSFVSLPAGMTRINVKLWGGLEGEINAQGPECDEKSLQALFEKLTMLTKEDTLVLSGSVPATLPKDVYVDMIKHVKDKAPRIVVDATGELLRSTLSYRPFLVKPNHHELGELYGATLTTKEDVAVYAKKLRGEGARNVLVSMAGDGAVLAGADGSVWFGEAPQGRVVNTVGSGDSMVAGFLAGYEAAQSAEQAFMTGIASGSASAFSAELGTKAEVEALLQKVQLKQVE